MRVDFCIPIKNEARTLAENLNRLAAYLEGGAQNYQWRIIGVINNSTDDSLAVCQQYEKILPLRIVCFTASGPGKGRAIKEGWRASNADILAFMDADLAVGLEAIPDLIDPIIKQEADLVIGSRFLPGAKAERSRRRAWVSKGYILLSRFFIGHKLTDIQCGFKAIRRKNFLKIERFLRDDFWFLDTELAVIAAISGAKIKEVPVNWQENRTNKNKSSIRLWQDSCHFIINLWRLRLRLSGIKNYYKDFSND